MNSERYINKFQSRFLFIQEQMIKNNNNKKMFIHQNCHLILFHRHYQHPLNYHLDYLNREISDPMHEHHRLVVEHNHPRINKSVCKRRDKTRNRITFINSRVIRAMLIESSKPE